MHQLTAGVAGDGYMVPVAIANGGGAINAAGVTQAKANFAGIIDCAPLDIVTAAILLAADYAR